MQSLPPGRTVFLYALNQEVAVSRSRCFPKPFFPPRRLIEREKRFNFKSVNQTLSSKTFRAAAITERAAWDVKTRGQRYFRDGWRCKIFAVEPSRAVVRVQGSRAYSVELALVDYDKIDYKCDCPYSRDFPRRVCKHAVAAALFLEDYLRLNSAQSWENHINGLFEAAGKSETRRKPELLIVSLQRHNAAYTLAAYRAEARHFPPEIRENAELFAAFVHENDAARFFSRINQTYGYFEPRNFAVNSAAQNAIAKLVVQSQSGYYSSSNYDLGFALSLLPSALVFRGTEAQPCKFPVRVLNEKARLEFEMRRGEQETELAPRVVLPDAERVFAANEKIELVCEKPLWVLADRLIFQIDASAELLSRLQRHGALKVPKASERDFFERHLTRFIEQFEISGDDLRFEDVKDFAPAPRLYLTETAESLQVNLRFGYGAAGEVGAAKMPASTAVSHDRERDVFLKIERCAVAETQFESLVSSAAHGLKRGSVFGSFDLRASVKPLDFLLKSVPKLAAAGFEIYGEEELVKHKLNRNRPQISFAVTSGIDWFDVQTIINYGEIAVSLAEMRTAIRRKEKFVKLADGSLGAIPTEFLEKYKHLFGLAKETDNGLRVSNHHLTLLDQLLAEIPSARFDAEFQKRKESLLDFDRIKRQKLPKIFHGDLRPYQRAGYDWLHFLREYKFGGCLADDMGLGKTVQMLAFLQSLKERGAAKLPHLLVVPRSLIFNWQREAAKFTPELEILDYSGANRTADPNDFVDYDVILTTYGVLLREIEKLSNYEFDTAILDEAQAIKNPVSESAKAARLVGARNRLTMTGTPVENNTLELWSQFAFLNPGLLGNLDYFRAEFAAPIERGADEASASFLRKMVYPFILRRTKDQVATDLPPKTERVIYCEMDAAQRKLYNQKRDFYRAKILKLIEEEGFDKSRMYVLEGLLRLRQICNHPKLLEKTYKGTSAKFDLLLETLKTLRAENHKALVFSQFVQMLKLVETEMKREKMPFAYLDGKTKNRQAKVDEFQENARIEFFLISLKAGGVGLNLTAAEYVLHVDPWWNPAVEMQATDRTHRIGQDKPVFVYKFIVRDSVEEKILQLQEKKRNLVKQLISAESGFFKNLTTADISDLFS